MKASTCFLKGICGGRSGRSMAYSSTLLLFPKATANQESFLPSEATRNEFFLPSEFFDVDGTVHRHRKKLSLSWYIHLKE